MRVPQTPRQRHWADAAEAAARAGNDEAAALYAILALPTEEEAVTSSLQADGQCQPESEEQ